MDVVSGAASQIFFFFFSLAIRRTWTRTRWTCPRPVVPAFRCGKKNSSRADIFGHQRWKFFFFRIYFVFFFSARGDPLSTAQKYVCLVVLSGSVHVQLYLPSVAEKKNSSHADIFGRKRKVWMFSCYRFSFCIQLLFFFRTRISVDASAKVWMSSCYQWKCPRPVVSAFRFRKKNSSHADIFGRKRKVWVFSCYSFSFCIQLLICFSARGYPLSPAQKYGCLVVISGSVHVQVYLPSVEEKKSSHADIFGRKRKVWMFSCYRFSCSAFFPHADIRCRQRKSMDV